MRKSVFLILLCCIIVFLFSCTQQGDKGPTGPNGEDIAILQFQTGRYPSDAYDGVTDAYLESGFYADTNYGSYASFFVGRYVFGLHNGRERFVLKFDLSELQNQYIKVKKAEIILYCNSGTPSSVTMTVTPYEITKVWEESEVTWNSSETSVAWTTAGGDYVATPAGSTIYIDKVNEYKIFNINASIVQKWIDNPDNNFGLIFISDTENLSGNWWVGFASKDNTNINYRPRLVIYYTLK
ncbi:MAG: DNRLRE domain-containing protein [Candidatus Goldbacteria bacterium]|nr:DNRLRE domain-containing protein [Candidatus Goldiibacteriota bacterium]